MMSYMGFFSASPRQKPASVPRLPQRTTQPMKLMENVFRRTLPIVLAVCLTALLGPVSIARLAAQEPGAAQTAAQAVPQHAAGGEANLVIPDLSTVTFLGGTN